MRIGKGLLKLAKYAYRFVKYGKQIGKTAKNGNEVRKSIFSNGKKLTGLDKDGKVLRTSKTIKTGKFSSITTVVTPKPFGAKDVTEIRIFPDDKYLHMTINKQAFSRYGFKEEFTGTEILGTKKTGFKINKYKL